MIDPEPNLPRLEATTAVSEFSPESIVMVWPSRKPIALATGITVAPASVEAPAVAAPAEPTDAMVAVSLFGFSGGAHSRGPC